MALGAAAAAVFEHGAALLALQHRLELAIVAVRGLDVVQACLPLAEPARVAADAPKVLFLLLLLLLLLL